MKNSFLVRLYRHSRTGFMVLVVYLTLYFIASFKGMDMALFPLNDMFSRPSLNSETVTVYVVESDGHPVKYTGFPYWRKDLAETALHSYAAYLERGQKTLLGVFMEKRHYPVDLRHRIEPETEKASQWPSWYLKYAGQSDFRDSLKIKSYQMVRTGNGLEIMDSALLLISKSNHHE